MFRVKGSGFGALGVRGLGLRVRGLGFRVCRLSGLRSSLGRDGLAPPKGILAILPSDLPDLPLTVCPPHLCVYLEIDLCIYDPI